MVPAPAPAFRPRPGGGFNQGMGAFNEEMDQQSMQTALQQKALTQQQSVTPTQAAAASQGPAQPREVGTLTEELLQRPAKDVAEGLVSFFDLHKLLNINPETDTPEEQAQKRQMHQRYQEMTEAEKAEAQKNAKMAMEQKQHDLQVEEQKKQAEAQQDKQLNIPTGKKDGPVGPGQKSHKQDMVAKLQHDRKTLSGPASAN